MRQKLTPQNKLNLLISYWLSGVLIKRDEDEEEDYHNKETAPIIWTRHEFLLLKIPAFLLFTEILAQKMKEVITIIVNGKK